MSDYITIELSKRGKHKNKYVALISLEDAELEQYNWCVCIDPYNKYATRVTRVDGKRVMPKMHREILERMLERKLLPDEYPDHINGNGLDNRRENLRVVTNQQNALNSRKHSNNKSGYKGVHFNKGKWVAQLRIDGKKKHLGRFDTPEEANEAVIKTREKYHGEFAKHE